MTFTYPLNEVRVLLLKERIRSETHKSLSQDIRAVSSLGSV